MRLMSYGVMAAAALVTVFGFIGLSAFSRSPYTGIQHQNLVFRGFYGNSPNRALPLRPGDRIASVDGIRPRNVNHFEYLVRSERAFERQEYGISRGDSSFSVSVVAGPQPPERRSQKLSRWLVGCTFLLVGFVVIVKRPDILGILFVVNCVILSFFMAERPVTSVPILHIAGELMHDFLFIFLPAFFLHFFLLFPGRELEHGTLRSRLTRILYIPSAALFAGIFVLALWRYASGGSGTVIRVFETLTLLYWVSYMALSVIAFARTYRASGSVQRVKFRIATIGLILGVLPPSAVMIFAQISPVFPGWVGGVSWVFLGFISISFAYAILLHGALDLGIVLRKSLVSLIIVAIIIALYYAIVEALGPGLAGRPGVQAAVLAFLVAVALALVPVRAGVQRLLDRTIGRARKVFTNEVMDFTRRIQFCTSAAAAASFVAEELRDLFDAEHGCLFLREPNGSYALAVCAPREKALPITSLSPDAGLVHLMREERSPLMLEYFDRLWLSANLDRISQELVTLSGTAVAAPLMEQDELVGFILLGRRRSGKPYGRSDADVLELLGERSAIAMQNIELCRISVEKERLEEELHLASAIQTRLLPSSAPQLAGATIAAGIKSSREVGGDFYDFLDLGQGKVGIAVADVSGKGIPAAILMTTLQASFRVEAAERRDPAQVLSALNNTLYRRSDPEKFATLFYGIYDDDNGTLRYSNGGSYPPFVLRSDGGLTKLHQGGILIGLEADYRYGDGVVKLRAGDLVVFYTDGFIDQENENREPFGEKRLVEYFRNNLRLSVDAMIEKLFATTIAFGQNNLKDDMTIVLLRKNSA